MVPDRLEFEGRLGVPVGADLQEARDALEAVVGFPLEWSGGAFAPGETPADHPWAKTVRGALSDELGHEAPIAGVPWGADMRLFTARGIPTVMVGTTDIEKAHAVDESVRIDELVTVARTIIRASCFRLGLLDSTRVLGGLLGGVELALHEVQALVPEGRVGEVHADDRAELLGRLRPARAEQLDVLGLEARALLLVAAVDRQREQLPVGVRVDVAGGGDEVGDVGPPRLVALGDLDRVAEQLLLRLAPRASRSRRRRARPASRRCVCTRCSKRFIATWRKTVAIVPSIDSASSDRRDSGVGEASSRRPNTSVSPNTEAVSASVSGVAMWNTPCLEPSAACTPCPSSCASVSTSRRRCV